MSNPERLEDMGQKRTHKTSLFQSPITLLIELSNNNNNNHTVYNCTNKSKFQAMNKLNRKMKENVE